MFSAASTLVGAALPCPNLRLQLQPSRARQLNPSFSIFQRARPSRAIRSALSAVTRRVVKKQLAQVRLPPRFAA